MTHNVNDIHRIYHQAAPKKTKLAINDNTGIMYTAFTLLDIQRVLTQV